MRLERDATKRGCCAKVNAVSINVWTHLAWDCSASVLQETARHGSKTRSQMTEEMMGWASKLSKWIKCVQIVRALNVPAVHMWTPHSLKPRLLALVAYLTQISVVRKLWLTSYHTPPKKKRRHL